MEEEPDLAEALARKRKRAGIGALFLAMRWERIFHYFLLTALGAAIHSGPALLHPTGPGIARTMLILGALAASAAFAVAVNDLADLKGDRISNPGRPLVSGLVSPRRWILIGIAGQALGLLLAAAAGMVSLVCVAGISLGYFLYSSPPLRLKRIPFVGKGVIGLNSLLAAIMGYAAAGGAWGDFPMDFALFVGIGLALSANFIDLKDEAGDRAMDVLSLPVMLGTNRARHLIVGFTLLSYVWAWQLTGEWWTAAPTGALCIIHIWLLYRSPYKESFVFAAYLSGIAMLAGYLVFFAPVP